MLSLPTPRVFGTFLLLFFVSADQAKAQKNPVPVIVIDPGHGGSSIAGSLKERSNSSPNNARSPSGYYEKNLTLEFSKILHDRIIAIAEERKQRVGVLMTRTDDRNLDFGERARICDRPDTACIVSIHFNASNSHDARGSLALIASEKRNPNYDIDHRFGLGLAEACANGIKPFLPGASNRGVITDNHLHGGLGSNFFFQLRTKKQLAKVPKAFLEVEFMDNPVVEKALLKGNRKEKFTAIANSIADYLLKETEPAAISR